MIWGYQFEGEKVTYYVPIEADDLAQAVHKIIVGQKRIFSGFVWPVEKATMFNPPKSGMKCWKIHTTDVPGDDPISHATETTYP
jgi:hypothetical protein